MQINFVAQQRMLSFSEQERLCQRRSLDTERLANLSGANVLTGYAPSLDLGIGINMLIHLKGEEAGFEPSTMRQWLPGLRSETLLRLAEDLDNWACPDPLEEWDSYVPLLFGTREKIRPNLARLLPGCCIATAVWKVKFFSATNVEAIKDENASWSKQDLAPRLVINADDLAQQVKRVCIGPLFTVRAKRSLAA